VKSEIKPEDLKKEPLTNKPDFGRPTPAEIEAVEARCVVSRDYSLGQQERIVINGYSRR